MEGKGRGSVVKRFFMRSPEPFFVRLDLFLDEVRLELDPEFG